MIDRWHPSEDLLREVRQGNYPDWYSDRKARRSKDEQTLEKAWALLRTGLRMPDGPVAIACAKQLEDSNLSGWEIARVVALLRDNLWPSPPKKTVDADKFETFRGYAGASDITYMLQHLPKTLDPRDAAYVIGKTHYQLRSTHIPVLCNAILKHENRALRHALVDNLELVCRYTDCYRSQVATTMLHYAGRYPPSPNRQLSQGIPPLLHIMLRSFFLEPREKLFGKKNVSLPSKGHLPETSNNHRQGFLWDWMYRWLIDSVPTESDLPLIRDLVASGHHHMSRGCCRILRHIHSAVSPELIGMLSDQLDDMDVLLHLKGLRGDDKATEQLLRRVGCDGIYDYEASALLALELSPQRTYDRIRNAIQAAKTDEEVQGILAKLTGEFTLYAKVHLKTDTPPWFWKRLHKDLFAVPLEPFTMLRLVENVPEFRTNAFLRKVAAHPAIRLRTCHSTLSETHPGFSILQVCLALADKPALRSLLWEWMILGTKDEQYTTLLTLLNIGDPARQQDLIRCVESWSDDDRWGQLLFQLGRTGGPGVVGYLKHTMNTLAQRHSPLIIHVLCSLAAAQGLNGGLYEIGKYDVPLEYTPFHEFEVYPTQGAWLTLLNTMIEALNRGEPVEALLAWLNSRETLFDLEEVPSCWGLGSVKDPRIQDYLWKATQRRNRFNYQIVLGELAISGDPNGLKEFWTICRAGRYRWVEDCDDRHRSLGMDLRTLPFLIEECATNCCRMGVVSDTVSEMVGWDITAGGTSPAHTYGLITTWMRRHGQHLQWSDLLGHYIPVWNN